ncbi:diguanylate cyclase [Pseudodesulfovibrio sp.]|nr:diguanylate cyclase [Pseudodesulfovibrio sp.]
MYDYKYFTFTRASYFMKISNINSRKLIDTIPCGIVVHASDSTVLYANPMAQRILGLGQKDIQGKGAADPQWRLINETGKEIDPQDYPVSQVLDNKEDLSNIVLGVVNLNNEITWLLVNAYAEIEDDEVQEVIVMFIDITKEKNSIPFKDIVALTSDAVIVTEANMIDEPGPRIVYVNNAFTDISGYTPEEVLGKTPRILQGEKTTEESKQRIRKALLGKRAVRETVLNYDKAGKEYWLDLNIYPLHDPFGNVSYFAAIERDVTQAKVEEENLRLIAIEDQLTSLLNRRGFTEKAQFLVAQARRMNWPLCLLMLDIDFFKKVNDTYGHDTGDEVLRTLGKLLKSQVRETDVVGRLGGEEFALVLPNTSAQDAHSLAEKIRIDVENLKVHLNEEKHITFTLSIGLATSVYSNTDLEKLLKEADLALYKAKQQGRNQTCVYSRDDRLAEQSSIS